MTIMERLERWNYKLQVQAAIRCAQWVLRLHRMDNIQYIEIEKMADQAETLIPKLQKELKELDDEGR